MVINDEYWFAGTGTRTSSPPPSRHSARRGTTTMASAVPNAWAWFRARVGHGAGAESARSPHDVADRRRRRAAPLASVSLGGAPTTSSPSSRRCVLSLGRALPLVPTPRLELSVADSSSLISNADVCPRRGDPRGAWPSHVALPAHPRRAVPGRPDASAGKGRS